MSVEPVSEESMDKDPRGDGGTICQVLRDIYHYTDDSYIRMKCRIAVTMAKKMAGKLRERRNGQA